jgi:hydrogenase maturation protein HypF
MRVTIRGAVQGVGFRPFIYRLAKEMGLKGWVKNNSHGVIIEAEASEDILRGFLLRINPEKPRHAFIQSMEHSYLEPEYFHEFTIQKSDGSDGKTAIVLPDIAICSDCLKEILDPGNRRYQYPFTNCTNCGPRYTIITSLPYDRPNTTMMQFQMCDDCLAEYNNPEDRRFHAQPNACPKCGPQIELWDDKGNILAKHHDALLMTADAIRNEKIAAIKGMGGFHLVVDARNNSATLRLRKLKRREEKPLALMYPSLEMAQRDCLLSELEKRLLCSPESPIVLLRRNNHETDNISDLVAPKNPYLGVMLPYLPLHYILMAELGFPIVATSGNISEEPICIDEHEALSRLGEIADMFLVHNRPIVRPVDDSIVCIMAGREMVMRRSRGYAPLPIQIKHRIPKTLAVGGHLKNTVAVGFDNQVFVSQHIGDLETLQTYDIFQKTIDSINNLYEFKPEVMISDMHPGYISTKYAEKRDGKLNKIQHHHAHIYSCMAENELTPPALGVAWDGTGYGGDGTIWGGEFFKVDGKGLARIAYFRQFHLPGGEKAIKEPRRTAIGMLYEIYGNNLFKRDDILSLKSFSQAELDSLRVMSEKNINSPLTSSAGRIFDAVASLTGIRQETCFEGQAAMELEFAIGGIAVKDHYPFESKISSPAKNIYIIDWQPMIVAIINEINNNIDIRTISVKFHNTMAEIITYIAQVIGEKRVVLSGGCFQNRYLTEKTIERLRADGFQPYWHQRIPPNDGGISLGQAAALLYKKEGAE